jgi:hypothetical protein
MESPDFPGTKASQELPVKMAKQEHPERKEMTLRSPWVERGRGARPESQDPRDPSETKAKPGHLENRGHPDRRELPDSRDHPGRMEKREAKEQQEREERMPNIGDFFGIDSNFLKFFIYYSVLARDVMVHVEKVPAVHVGEVAVAAIIGAVLLSNKKCGGNKM